MHLCVRGVEFVSFYDFCYRNLESFRECDIVFIFVFHFITWARVAQSVR
jgi:hypothetical protein